MRQKKLCGVATAAVAAVALASPVQAACWWTGYGYACITGPTYGYGLCQFNNPAAYGHVPRGLPHANGAQAGEGGRYQGQAKNGCGDEQPASPPITQGSPSVEPIAENRS